MDRYTIKMFFFITVDYAYFGVFLLLWQKGKSKFSDLIQKGFLTSIYLEKE